MRRSRIIIIALLLLLIAGAAIVLYVFHKPARNVSGEHAVAVLHAKELLQEFQQDEATATAKYLDKVIEVIGEVSLVQDNPDGSLSVLLRVEGSMAGINCVIPAGEHFSKINQGEFIRLKGVCTGMTMDVVLAKCVLLE